MKAPIGAEVKLYVDLFIGERPCQPGDAIETSSGRRYLVLDARTQQRGVHKGRQHLRCIVGDGTEKVQGTTYQITWYRRDKRRKAH